MKLNVKKHDYLYGIFLFFIHAMKKILFYLTSALIFTATFTACTAEITTLPAGVTLDQSSIKISPGESLMLTAELFPGEAVIKTLTWSSNNPAIATVANGVVTGVTEGTTAITVTTNSGQKMAACVVTVAYPVSGVVLDKGSTFLPLGQNLSLTATVMPEDTPDKTITWISSNPDVATVDNGVVRTRAAGTTDITVITTVGSRTASTTVKVLPENAGIITVSLQPAEFVSFEMAGSDVVDIDWGDFDYNSYPLHIGISTYFYRYETGAIPRTILIAGPVTHLETVQASELDLTRCTTLTTLICSGIQMTNLDVSTNTALRILNCSGNHLENLDVSNNIALTELNCSGNRLTGLDVSRNTALRRMNCTGNDFSATALNDLFETLPPGTNGSLDIRKNPGTTECNRTIAENRGWRFPMQIILTAEVTGSYPFSFWMAGNGGVEIDWGDGSEDYIAPLTYYTTQYSHMYSGTSFRTITLTSEGINSLSCNSAGLTNLVAKNYASIESLDCNYNQLTDLDVSGATSLRSLYCGFNQMSDLNLNGVTALERLWCPNNYLTTLNLSTTAKLNNLVCSNNWLTDLNVSSSMYHLECNYNQLTSLDVRGAAALYLLQCHGNQLTSLDVSGAAGLQELYCDASQLTSLNVSGAANLRILYCNMNQLTTLDVSKNTQLTNLNCENNELTSLDMSANTMLYGLSCSYNLLTAGALNAMFRSLHGSTVNGGFRWINIFSNPGTDTCDQTIATNKGWAIYLW